jgi:hypothetical protein
MSDKTLYHQRLARALAPILHGLGFVKPVQGTYTPTYLGGTTPGTTTYSLQEGAWTRFGNIVFVNGVVVWTAANGTGEARISLPFVPTAGAARRASGGLRVVNVTFTTTTPVLILNPTAAYFTMESPASNTAGNTIQVEAAGNVTFSLSYGVD